MTKHDDPKRDPARRPVVGGAIAYADYQRLLGEGPSFWDALLAFRATLPDAQSLDIDARTFPRDASPGRPVSLPE